MRRAPKKEPPEPELVPDTRQEHALLEALVDLTRLVGCYCGDTPGIKAVCPRCKAKQLIAKYRP